MTATLSLTQLIDRLRLPQQDLSELSFCQSAKPARVAAWAGQLPVTRITHTSVLLYQALPEVSRLRTTAESRFAILEALRSYVLQCIEGLSANFLDQPLILPEAAMKTAIIAQALQKHMSNGYSQVVKDLLSKRGNGRLKTDESNLLAQALHRALTGLGLQYLRNSQIYSQVSSQLWLEMNTLYLIAEVTGLSGRPVSDNLLRYTSACTLQHAYCRTLLLSCANPNQLQQQEVNSLYDALEDWAQFVSLDPLRSNDNATYCVDIAEDFPPSYTSQWLSHDTQPATLRALHLGKLLDCLVDPTAGGSTRPRLPQAINPRLIQHLLRSWGEERHRKLPRRTGNAPLEVVVGLTQVHYHLAQQRPFDLFLSESALLGNGSSSSQFVANDLQVPIVDPWSQAFDAEKLRRPDAGLSLGNFRPGEEPPQNTPKDRYPIHQVQMSDASSGGYCIEWHEQIPPQARAGELLALREPGRPQWSLGVIRWARQHRGSSQLGVQLIALEVLPVAAQQQQKSGANNVFMRAFLANRGGPELNRQVLITAAVPFREGNKVLVRADQQEMLLQLSHLDFSASSTCAFSYRHLSQGPQDADEE